MTGLLGFLWSLPGTVVGALACLLFGPLGVSFYDGVWWVECRRWPTVATTFGRVVVGRPPISARTGLHEYEHVRQWDRWGPLFFVVYPLAHLWAAVVRGDAKQNPFEVAARAAEEEP